MLICPKCGQPLLREEKRAVCPQGHSFDLARQGYWNFLLSSSTRGHGDDLPMLRARREFLDRGHYRPLADAICRKAGELFPEKGVLLDAGCGEGYYTQKVAESLREQGREVDLFAFDIAKDAARLTASRMEKRGSFFVASAYRVPMASESVDLALSLFSPYAEDEFLRLLKPGGFLLCATAREEHLYSLKAAVYEKVVKNVTRIVPGDGFCQVWEERIRKTLTLTSSQEIQSLFQMTPYAHKTGQEDMKKLEKLTSLSTELDFGLVVYQKKESGGV